MAKKRKYDKYYPFDYNKWVDNFFCLIFVPCFLILLQMLMGICHYFKETKEVCKV